MVLQGWRRSLGVLIQIFSTVHVLDYGLLPFHLDHDGNFCGRAEERGKPLCIRMCAIQPQGCKDASFPYLDPSLDWFQSYYL